MRTDAEIRSALAILTDARDGAARSQSLAAKLDYPFLRMYVDLLEWILGDENGFAAALAKWGPIKRRMDAAKGN
jgi:hypothetical protein